MRKWSVIVAATAFTFFALADLVHDFVANDPVGYFSAKPNQMFYVGAIAIVGGLAALGFYRLSPRAQRHLRVFSWGAAASAMTAVVGYAVFCFVSLFSFIAEFGGTIQILEVLLLLLVFSGIAAYFWYEFCRVWKTGISR